MATQLGDELSHVVLPLSGPPPSSFFSETQWKVWYALMDTLIPCIVPTSAVTSTARDKLQISQSALDDYFQTIQSKVTNPPSREAFDAYLSEKPSENQLFKDHMVRALSLLPKDAKGQIGSILSLLGTRLGSFPLTGHFTPFFNLSASARESVLLSWQSSYIAAFRSLAKTIGMLGKKVWIQTSPLFNELSGWKDLPEDYKPGQPAEYSFKQFVPGGDPEVVETDVVIVGSGCGGGVSAKVLAEAGYRVIVVDKGYYFPPTQLPMRTATADMNLFENGGVLGTDDGSMSIIAGSTWGGGGSINWGVSLKTPNYIREDWAKKRGLTLFTSPEFQASLDRVCDFMGVSDTAVRQNHRGQALLDGAAKLGLKAQVTPHNCGNEDHYCGHCHLGCSSGGKKGPAISWLPAAARAGAEFIEGFQVDRVTFDDFASGKKASGVVGKWVSRNKDGHPTGSIDQLVIRDVVIKAKRVILSSGTLWSPVILRNSGLSNPQIGRNTYLHPVNLVGAFWKDDLKPWEGCAITSVVTALENLDGDGHGTKLEPMCMVPHLTYAQIPWQSGVDYKITALRYRHLSSFFSMPRDRDTGYVYPDPETRKPRVEYTPSAFDRAHIMEGLLALLKICYATGAEEIRAFLPGVKPFVRDPSEYKSEVEDARFEKWLRSVRTKGNPVESSFGCAHQMGSCRMSKSAEDGVVDPKGKVWGVEGLYVADASVFPTASGVNPMVTNMAISDCISRGIAADLKELKVVR